MATICPTAEQLAGIGESNGSCPTGIAAHIDDCPDCQRFLARRVHSGLEIRTAHEATYAERDVIPQISGFTIERELGRGAMGVVYLARRDPLSRPIALKLLPGGRRASSRERRQWLREAESASVLKHPNVVTLYEAGEADDCFLLALEYVPGGTLAERLIAPIAPIAAARLMETIARAVHHIHQHGLLHLDLKPSNILIDDDAGSEWGQIVPKVSDFSIARSSEPGATETIGLNAGGSPPYMAPEQIVRPREEMRAAADIHALGAIFYRMLTGLAAYRGATVFDTLEQVRSQEPVPPRRLISRIPRDLETIALKCLQKSPASRYPTAEALAADLRSWLDGRPIVARPVSPVEIAWRWCRRRPAIAALLAALAFTFSSGLLAAVLLWRHAEAEKRRAQDDLYFAERLLNDIIAPDDPSPRITEGLAKHTRLEILWRTRDQILKLRGRRSDDSTTGNQLALVDIQLGTQFAAQKSFDKAHASLNECLGILDEVLRLHPGDETAKYLQFRAHHRLGNLLANQGKREDAIGHLETAVMLGERCVRRQADCSLIKEVVGCRWSLAELLRGEGHEQRAQSLILANFQLLDGVSKDNRDPFLAIWRVLVRLDLRDFNTRLQAVSAAPAGESDPLDRLASPEADRLDPKSWAELVVHSLCSNPREPALRYHYLSSFADHASERISCLRRMHRIDETRQYASRLNAFARLVVERYPDQPAAHLALCTSYMQIAKDAWNPANVVVVAANWRLALEAARHALSLDALDTRASVRVADLEDRLERLIASNPSLREHRAKS
jgi:serine/threonine protein kinase